MANMLTITLSDTPTSRVFAALDLEDRNLAACVGTEVLDCARDCAKSWGKEEGQARIASLRASLAAQADDSAAALRSAVRSAVERERACAEGEAARLRRSLDSAERRLRELQSVSEENARARAAETRSFYESKLSALQARLDEAVSVHHNSTKKGQYSEVHVLSRLNMLFPRAEIEDTHATPGRGDFIIRDDGFCFMIETKNYGRNVPKSEVDKFYRDVEDQANADCQGAILVSLRSGVACREDFTFEMRGDKPVLFIHHLERNFDSLLLARRFFGLVLSAGSSVDLGAKATEDGLRAAAAALKRGYAKQRGRLNRFHSDQLALVAEQEARIVELYGVLGQKL